MGRADNDDVLDRRRVFVVAGERAPRGAASRGEIGNSTAEEVVAKVGDAPETYVDRAVRMDSYASVEWSRTHPQERGGPLTPHA